MEPWFHDQQVVLARATSEAENSQIVIAYVDTVWKDWPARRLISLNANAPIDVNGNESFAIKGVVISALNN